MTHWRHRTKYPLVLMFKSSKYIANTSMRAGALQLIYGFYTRDNHSQHGPDGDDSDQPSNTRYRDMNENYI
jgi:hypothetical protein